ncbi:hypothetical protein O3G_MSEX001867 [Manduca sexta]|uniref:G-protein coupled receptors family 1 profile domain-containing protein n=1 Tax=Manduca sexta TaxID=7130 RepID=A0A921YMT8_MANSE|nr:hypothetical protein O3G_MSEX001867 [Manduca sexta]KAG6441512.1 hypothetical protein O3G_MSEX001867 [Manduca sexta]
MYVGTEILLFTFITMAQCLNIDFGRHHKTLNNSLIVKHNDMCESGDSVYIKQFKCDGEYQWRRWDLRQWKRRRRMSNFLFNRTDEYRQMETSADNEHLNFGYKHVADPIISIFEKRWPIHLWRQYSLFSDDFLLLINTHWLQFPPPRAVLQYSLAITYVVLVTIGCFGNFFVMFMYHRCRTLRTPGNILVANLALSDFMMLAKTPIFIFNSFNLGPALGKPGCVIYGFIGGLTGTTSIATLSAIAMDRYWAVVRPLEPLRALTVIRARLLAVGSWIYACFFAIIPALDIGCGHYVPEGFLTSCSFDYLTEELASRYFIFIFFCAAWLLPFCTISFCYISIFRVVVCNRNITTQNQEQRLSSKHVKERTKRKAEIKLAFLVMAVIVLFFVSWTPYAIIALLGIFGKKDLIKPLTSMIPALFCKTAACINPFIYIITHPTFRKEFKKLLFRDKSKRMRGTMKTIGYSYEAHRAHRLSKDLSETEVEILEMKDIPYQNEIFYNKPTGKLATISSRVTQREDSQRSISMKSLEETVVSPPSWYCKPQFVKKKSFHRSSSRSVVSQNTDPAV